MEELVNELSMPKKGSSIITVIGVGGAGGNALNYMWNELATINWCACADIPSRAKALGANVDSMYLILPNGITLYEPQLKCFINKEM